MRDYSINGRTVSVPECIDELTAEQYITFLRLVIAFTSGHVSESFLCERWLSVLAGMKNGASYRIMRTEIIDEIERMGAEVLPGFIADGKPNLRTCRNLLPSFDGHDGPGDFLYGMSFGDFVECLTLLEMSADDDSDECYRKIAMVMYGYAEGESLSPLLVYHAVLLLYNVWSTVQSEPVEIDGRKIDMSIIFKGGDSSKADDNTGWQGITMEVAQAGLFGNVADVRKSAVWDVLLYLYKCKFESMNKKS